MSETTTPNITDLVGRTFERDGTALTLALASLRTKCKAALDVLEDVSDEA